MKHCPKCSRVYADDALNFCLDDGEWLAPFEPTEATTAILSGDPVREAPTRQQVTLTDPKAETKTSGTRENSKSSKKVYIAIAATALIVIGFGVYKYAGSTSSTKKFSFESAKVSRLTNSGKVINAAISPDGKYVVYVQDDGGKQSLWLRQTNTQSNVQILPPSESYYSGLVFTPDGDHIYYAATEKSEAAGSLYQLTTLGGTPTKILSGIDGGPTISPDGKQIAFVRTDQIEKKQSLMIADSEGKNERSIAERKGADIFFQDYLAKPSWSPDGKTIACSVGNINENQMTVATFNVNDGATKLFTRKWLFVTQISWVADGTSLLLTVKEDASSGRQIWRVAYPSGEAERVTNDLENYMAISLTADSASLITVQREFRSNLWVSTVRDADSHSRQLTTGVNKINGLSLASDGKIAYSSNAGGNQDIWLTDTQGSFTKQLTVNSLWNDEPVITKDGRFIVFMSDRSEAPHIWRMDIEGRNQIPITKGDSEEPSVTPDGHWVFYAVFEAAVPSVWRVPIDGGEPKHIIDKPSYFPSVSPDGKQFACLYHEKAADPWGIAIFPLDGGQPVRTFALPDATFTNLAWTADGQNIVYGITRDGVTNLWQQPVDGSPPKQMTDFKNEGIQYFDLSADGKQLAASRGTRTTDVVLISNFR